MSPEVTAAFKALADAIFEAAARIERLADTIDAMGSPGNLTASQDIEGASRRRSLCGRDASGGQMRVSKPVEKN